MPISASTLRAIAIRSLTFVSTLICTNVLGWGGEWVAWDRGTDRVVSHTDRAAAYPRARKLSNGSILLGYHHGGGQGEYGTWVTVRHTKDGGKEWSPATDVEGPEGQRFWGFSNVDFMELRNGRVLMATAARGKALPGTDVFTSECQRNELRLRVSNDYGVTWGAPQAIAIGRGRVWEPSIVRLPNGELQIYFANEAPDLRKEGRQDQRIEVTRSLDDGRTWSEPVEVSQHPRARNGMPAALLLSDGNVACAMEMVGEPKSPWITQMRDGRPVEEYIAQTECRFGAAPFLLALPRGRTALTFHSGYQKQPAPEGAQQSWMFSHLWLQLGDRSAKNFASPTRPWPDLDSRTGAYFGSLLLKDNQTLVALASIRTLDEKGENRSVIRWIEGKLDLD